LVLMHMLAQINDLMLSTVFASVNNLYHRERAKARDRSPACAALQRGDGSAARAGAPRSQRAYRARARESG
jgi:hypothetical protein